MPVATLTTLERCKRYLSISSEEHDAVLEDLLAGASAAIENAAGRSIRQARTRREWHNGGFPAIALEHRPVVEVHAVYDGDGVVDAASYEVESGSGRLLAAGPAKWGRGLRRYRIDYSHGWTEIPEDLQAACAKQVAAEFKQTSAGGARVGLTSESSEVGNTLSFGPDGLLPSVREVARSYQELI